MPTPDKRHQQVQDLAGRITALRKQYHKNPSYRIALQIQTLTRKRNKIIAELRSSFELAVNNG